eukprot:TRINITY_DN27670_c0_g1_i1.p1 TRINITY_DN27670_c0_g1~~TRINITY_DN27670_c0_g1_i1.p1  ORF type:complete len:2846 (-),score=222.69 TRINITY_DN27670_c0_g1_i1:6612-14009(-)
MDGDDTIFGSGGSDVLDGGSNTDILTYKDYFSGSGVDINISGPTDTVVKGSAGTDTISGFEKYIGSFYADEFIGDADANYFDGYWGDDTIFGGAGADSLYGNYGDDTFVIEDATLDATISGGGDEDTLRITTDIDLENDSFYGNKSSIEVIDIRNNETINLSDTNAQAISTSTLTITDGADGNAAITLNAGTKSYSGGSYVQIKDTGTVTLTGDNYITLIDGDGTSDPDVILGGGNDTIVGSNRENTFIFNTSSTATAGDSINGRLGVDTVSITDDKDISAVSLTSIERLSIEGSITATITGSQALGFEQIAGTTADNQTLNINMDSDTLNMSGKSITNLNQSSDKINIVGTDDADTITIDSEMNVNGQGGSDTLKTVSTLDLSSNTITAIETFDIANGTTLTLDATQLSGKDIDISNSGDLVIEATSTDTDHDFVNLGNNGSGTITLDVNSSVDLSTQDLGAVDTFDVDSGKILTLNDTQAISKTFSGNGDTYLNYTGTGVTDYSSIIRETDADVRLLVESGENIDYTSSSDNILGGINQLDVEGSVTLTSEQANALASQDRALLKGGGGSFGVQLSNGGSTDLEGIDTTGFTGTFSIMDSSGDDNITATSGDDVIYSIAGGVDTIDAKGGDDTINLSTVSDVDGGNGTDRLNIQNGVGTLDLSAKNIDGIEIVDIDDGEILKLNADVLDANIAIDTNIGATIVFEDIDGDDFSRLTLNGTGNATFNASSNGAVDISTTDISNLATVSLNGTGTGDEIFTIDQAVDSIDGKGGNSDTLNIEADNIDFSSTTIAGVENINVNGTADLTGKISDSKTITVANNETLTLSGSDLHNKTITLNGSGTININASSDLDLTSATIANTLTVNVVGDGNTQKLTIDQDVDSITGIETIEAKTNDIDLSGKLDNAVNSIIADGVTVTLIGADINANSITTSGSGNIVIDSNNNNLSGTAFNHNGNLTINTSTNGTTDLSSLDVSTPAVVIVNGSTGNETIKIGVAGVDEVNGLGGTDTLELTSTHVPDTISNIETINVKETLNLVGKLSNSVDSINVDSGKTLTINGSDIDSANNITLNNNGAINVNNLNNSVNLGDATLAGNGTYNLNISNNGTFTLSNSFANSPIVNINGGSGSEQLNINTANPIISSIASVETVYVNEDADLSGKIDDVSIIEVANTKTLDIVGSDIDSQEFRGNGTLQVSVDDTVDTTNATLAENLTINLVGDGDANIFTVDQNIDSIDGAGANDTLNIEADDLVFGSLTSIETINVNGDVDLTGGTGGASTFNVASSKTLKITDDLVDAKTVSSDGNIEVYIDGDSSANFSNIDNNGTQIVYIENQNSTFSGTLGTMDVSVGSGLTFTIADDKLDTNNTINGDGDVKVLIDSNSSEDFTNIVANGTKEVEFTANSTFSGDFATMDKITITGATTTVTMDGSKLDGKSLTLEGEGSLIINASGTEDFSSLTNNLNGTTTINDSMGSDDITATNSDDTINLSSGGSDSVDAGAGVDTINVSQNTTSINGGSDTDTLNVTNTVSVGALTSVENVNIKSTNDLTSWDLSDVSKLDVDNGNNSSSIEATMTLSQYTTLGSANITKGSDDNIILTQVAGDISSSDLSNATSLELSGNTTISASQATQFGSNITKNGHALTVQDSSSNIEGNIATYVANGVDSVDATDNALAVTVAEANSGISFDGGDTITVVDTQAQIDGVDFNTLQTNGVSKVDIDGADVINVTVTQATAGLTFADNTVNVVDSATNIQNANFTDLSNAGVDSVDAGGNSLNISLAQATAGIDFTLADTVTVTGSDGSTLVSNIGSYGANIDYLDANDNAVTLSVSQASDLATAGTEFVADDVVTISDNGTNISNADFTTFSSYADSIDVSDTDVTISKTQADELIANNISFDSGNSVTLSATGAEIEAYDFSELEAVGVDIVDASDSSINISFEQASGNIAFTATDTVTISDSSTNLNTSTDFTTINTNVDGINATDAITIDISQKNYLDGRSITFDSGDDISLTDTTNVDSFTLDSFNYTSIDMGSGANTLTVSGSIESYEFSYDSDSKFNIISGTDSVSLTNVDKLIFSEGEFDVYIDDGTNANVINIGEGNAIVISNNNGELTVSDSDGSFTANQYIVQNNGSPKSLSTLDSPNDGTIVDGIISNLAYETSSGITGYTDESGGFRYNDGDSVTFKIGGIIIGTATAEDLSENMIFLQDLADVSRGDLTDEYVTNMAVFLQSLDSQGTTEDGLQIDDSAHEAFADNTLDLSSVSLQDVELELSMEGVVAIDEQEAMEHVKDMLEIYGGLEESDFIDSQSGTDKSEDTETDTSAKEDTVEDTTETEESFESSIDEDGTIDFSSLDSVESTNDESIESEQSISIEELGLSQDETSSIDDTSIDTIEPSPESATVVTTSSEEVAQDESAEDGGISVEELISMEVDTSENSSSGSLVADSEEHAEDFTLHVVQDRRQRARLIL